MSRKGFSLAVWTAAFLALASGDSEAQPFVTHDETLPTSQPGPVPARIPGTGTVTVHARGADGSIPVGSYCWMTPFPHSLPQQTGWSPAPDWPTNRPTIVGSNGDWVVYNVTPFASGAWAVQIDSTNYLFTPELNIQTAEPISNQSVSVSFTLRLGATVMGRVLDAETGKPVPGASIFGSGYHEAGEVNGADGRFTIQHLATNEALSFSIAPNPRYVWHTNGTARVALPESDYVQQNIRPAGLAEGMTTTLPDVKLRHGGWISGRMTLPADAPSGVRPVLQAPKIEGDSVPTDYPEAYGSNGVFRIGPIPAGTVELSADSFLFKSGNPWRAEGSVTNIHVEAGQETKNVLIELKTIRASNGR